MKKYVKILSVIALSLTLFTGCENFLSGSKVNEEVTDLIADINAETRSILITSKTEYGSTIPNGNQNFKIEREKKRISFSESSSYSFDHWQVEVRNDKGETTQVFENNGEYYSIEDENNPVTTITILKYLSGMTITPVCSERIAIDGTPSPAFVSDGVSRDRSISVAFTQEPDSSSFLFDEIPAEGGYSEDALVEGPDAVTRYAYYSLNDTRIYKNITIKDSDGEDMSVYFNPPKVEGKYLTLSVAKQIPIGVTGYRLIDVTLSGDISYLRNNKLISMNKDITWRYKITEATDKKAFVTVTSKRTEDDKLMAKVTPEITNKDYSMDFGITLGVTENDDYQFVKWNFDSKYIYIEEPYNPSAKAIVREPTPENEATVITAYCVPRLRVTSVTPVNDFENQYACKNSAVVLTFSKNLSDKTEDLKQLDNISITIGGESVRQSFATPVLSDNIVSFAADNTNMITVQPGQTKTVTVTVPSDFYYVLEDGTKITVGGKGYSYNYKIDETTVTKASVLFQKTEGSGTITPAEGTAIKYSMGQTAEIKFEPNDDFIFDKWTVLSNGQEVSDTKIYVADRNSKTTEITVFEAFSDLIIKANCIAKFNVTDTEEKPLSPKGTDANPSPKDSDIVIPFNKPLSASCNLSKIKVTMDGSNVDKYFETRTRDDAAKTVTLVNTKLLSVKKDETKLITVTVPKEFYYEYKASESAQSKSITLEDDYTFTYTVDYKTIKKAGISVSIIDGETLNSSAEVVLSGAGTLNEESQETQFYLGQTVNLSLQLNDGYQFAGWKTKASDGTAVTSDVFSIEKPSSLETSVEIKKEIENSKIYAVCYKRPTVIAKTPPELNRANDEYAKNTPIVIEFSHAIETGCENAIEVSYSGANISKDVYFSTELNATRTQVTLNPNKMLPFANNSIVETVTVKLPHNKIFYKNAARDYTVYMDDSTDYEWSYKVNNSTVNKIKILYNFTSGGLKVNGNTISSGNSPEYNEEDVISLLYVPSSAVYKFNGWTVTTGPSGYIVDDTVNGVIKVTKDGIAYVSITFDEQNPASAELTVNKVIGNGQNNYGLKIEPSEIEVPSAKTEDLGFTSEGIECDKPVKITFNKQLKANTLSLYSSASNPGSIQIVNALNSNEHYEQYFTSSLGNGLKELALTPSTEIVNAFNGISAEYIDIKVILDPQQILDTAGLSLSGNTEWTYRINRNTNAKTTVKFILPESYVTFDGSRKNNEDTVPCNIGQSFTLNYVVSDNYVFTGWTVTAEDCTVTKNENTITVKNDDVIFLTMQTDGETAVVDVKEKCSKQIVIKGEQKLLPSSNTKTIGNNTATGIECDTPIAMEFNKPLDEDTLSKYYIDEDENEKGTIQIVSSTNESEHYEDYFTYELEDEGKKLVLIPSIEIKNIFNYISASVFELKVKINAGSEKIKDTEGLVLTGKTEWVYKINSNTNAKTTVLFNTGAGSLKVNNVNKESGSILPCNVGQVLNLKYNVSSNIKFTGWYIAANGYTTYCNSNCQLINSNGYVNEQNADSVVSGSDYYLWNGNFIIKNNSGNECLRITAESNNLTVTVNKGIDVEGQEYSLRITTREFEISKVQDNYIPVFSNNGVYCDSPIVITCNKNVKASSVYLDSIDNYGNVSYEGSIRIVNLANENESFAQYFYAPKISGNTITIKPKNSIVNLVSSVPTKDIKVIVKENKIETADGKIIENKIEWTYRINTARENTKPTWSSFNLYKADYQYYEPDTIENYTELSDEHYNSWNFTNNETITSKYITNHIKNKVYIDCKGIDRESGVDRLKIVETLVYNNNSNLACNIVAVNENNVYEGFLRSNDIEDEYVYTSKFRYELLSELDGIVKLDFYLIDQAGNVSEQVKTYYVIKDTKAKAPENGLINNNKSLLKNGNDSTIKSYSPSNSASRTYAVAYDDFVRISDDNSDTYVLTFKQYNSNYAECSVNDYFCQKSPVYYFDESKNKIEVHCSDDQVNWTEIPEDTQGSYSYTIQRNKTKDTFIKIKATDYVGNEDEIIRVIPRNVVILDHELSDLGTLKLTNSLNCKYYAHAVFTKAGFSESKENADSFGALEYDCLVYYKYKATGSSEYENFYRCEGNEYYKGHTSNDNYGPDSYRSCDFFYRAAGIPHASKASTISVSQQNFRPAGTYAVYLIPYFSFGNSIRYFGTASDPYVFNITYDDDNNISITANVGTITETDDIFPQKPVITLDEPVPNIGTRNAHYSYDLQENEHFDYLREYTYFIGYKIKDSSEDFTYVNSYDFILESNYLYEIRLFVKNREGNIASVPCSYKYITDGVINYSVYIDALYDNTPPSMIAKTHHDVTKIADPLNTLCITNYGTVNSTYLKMPNDSGVGLKKNSLNEVELTYWIFKSAYQDWGQSVEQYTAEDLQGIPGIQIRYKEDEDYFYIPYDSAEMERDCWYTLVLRIEDENGNYSYNSMKFPHNPENTETVPSINTFGFKTIYSTKYYGFKLNLNYYIEYINNEDRGTYYAYADYINTDNQKWQKCNIDTFDQSQTSMNHEPEIIVPIYKKEMSTIPDNMEKAGFYRLNVNDSGNVNGGANRTRRPTKYKPVYVYADFVLTKEGSEIKTASLKQTPVCHEKNLLMGSNGVQVYCDNPTLIQVFYSAHDYGDDAEGWLYNAAEVDVSIVESSGTYIIDKSKIPSGCYYAAVAHFADNTMCASDSRLKR